MWAAEHRDVQQRRGLGVECERLTPGNDAHCSGGRDRTAHRVSGRGDLRVCYAADRIVDRTVAGAPAQVSLQQAWQVVAICSSESGCCHDHPGRAEAALEAARIDECLLHRVRFLGRSQPRDRCDAHALKPVRRGNTGVDGDAIEEYRAGAAVPGVAPLLHFEVTEVVQHISQYLAGAGLGLNGFTVHREFHRSSRISWANRRLIACRQSGLPCASSYQSSIESTAALSLTAEGSSSNRS